MPGRLQGRSSFRRVAASTWLVTTLVTPLFAVASVRADDKPDLAAAKKQFLTSCGVCHTVNESEGNRQGPNLATVFGRKAGTYAGFAYSDTLMKGGWVWDEKTLDPWIENSQAAHPGTYMNYRQTNESKRALVIAYLKSLKGTK